MKRKSITHKDVLNHICENLEQKLHSPTCRAVKRHLDQCPECASYLDSLKKTVILYKRYPLPKLSKTAHKRLLFALSQER